jgi:4-hydroxy-2-oxoheptanedioate aldolase
LPDNVSLRERLRSGPLRLGITVASMSPSAVEVAGLCGAEFVWIEIEHGGIDLMQVEHLCRAAELRGVIPLLRIQDGSRPAVLRALEAGGKIIVVPQVHTAEQAAAVVEYGKFPPLGERGFNTGTRGLLYGFSGASPLEIFANANRDTCLLAQIESMEAVANAEAIIATEGLDGILVGPGDLTATMGIPAQWDSEELITTCEKVFALAHKHQKVVATVCPTPAMTKRWKAAGAHLLCVAGDLGLMTKALKETLAAVRGA